MKFIDEAKVEVLAGAGGDGIISWRREKYLPNGGPDGGSGGNGGAVIFEADEGENTLLGHSYNPRKVAESGKAGGSNCSSGAAGANLICKVPVGTQVFYGDRLVADLENSGSQWIAARGGRGGRGNASFKSASCQAPDFARPGQPGEAFCFKMVLKSVADIGLVGLPNAGKSTLVSTISAATPKIANYPFTTLKPSLGVVEVNSQQPIVIADIPGLVPGASTGRGLGIQFLKHIERSSALLHLLDASSLEKPNLEERSKQVLEDFRAIESELKAFSEKTKTSPRLVVFTKADQPLVKDIFEILKPKLEEQGLKAILISCFSGEGLDELKSLLPSLCSY